MQRRIGVRADVWRQRQRAHVDRAAVCGAVRGVHDPSAGDDAGQAVPAELLADLGVEEDPAAVVVDEPGEAGDDAVGIN